MERPGDQEPRQVQVRGPRGFLQEQPQEFMGQDRVPDGSPEADQAPHRGREGGGLQQPDPQDQD